MLGHIVIAIEMAVALTVIGTALFGSRALSERAFRLLRWIANRPEPPDLISCTPVTHLPGGPRHVRERRPGLEGYAATVDVAADLGRGPDLDGPRGDSWLA